MSGVLVIDKPKGWTSHDVVARVRRVLGVKRAGHGGTLDPLATGVLPIYLGEGTKLVAFNLEGTKQYQATMKLGQETDTLDAGGKVTAEKEGFHCDREVLEEVLQRFRGPIRQLPPLFSAIKQKGLPLYKRARAGERPQLTEREAMVYTLSLKELALPLVTLEITCGRGTYIRSLCADIGHALGCGAHLVELRRLRTGKFTLDHALRIEDFSSLAEQGRIGEKVIPLKEGVDLSGRIQVEKRTAERVRRGQPLRLSDLPEGEGEKLKKGQRMGIFHGPEMLLAIAECQVDGGPWLSGNPQVLRILRVFHG